MAASPKGSESWLGFLLAAWDFLGWCCLVFGLVFFFVFSCCFWIFVVLVSEFVCFWG